MTLTLLFLSIVSLAGPAEPAVDPLAPAREGRLQCHTPDIARKSCSALAGYTFGPDGVILNQAEVLLVPSALVIMRNEAPVVVREDAVCGPLAGLEKATFTIGGQPAAAATADSIRSQVAAAYAAIGAEGCTRYGPQGDTLLATVSVDGQPRPDLNQTVIWVSPDEGYAVKP